MPYYTGHWKEKRWYSYGLSFQKSSMGINLQIEKYIKGMNKFDKRYVKGKVFFVNLQMEEKRIGWKKQPAVKRGTEKSGENG